MSTLRIGGMNFYEGNKRRWADASLIRSLDLDLAGVCEAWRARRVLAAASGMRRIGGVAGGGPVGRGPGEVVVLMRKTAAFTLLGSGTDNDTPDLGTRVAHDRWHTTLRAATPAGRVSLISTHANASIIGKDGKPLSAQRVELFKQHMEKLARAAAYERASGFSPLIVGDLNVWRGTDWRYAPDEWFGRIGLTGLDSHVDWILYDPDDFRKMRHQIIDPHGADHKWHVATLERR